MILWLLEAVYFVYALTIVNPTSNTVWRSGTNVQVKWNMDDGNVWDGTGRISLMVGPGNGVEVMRITDSVPISDGEVSWTVSNDLSARKDYFVSIQSNQATEIAENSPRFVIVESTSKTGGITNSAAKTNPVTILWAIALLHLVYLS